VFRIHSRSIPNRWYCLNCHDLLGSLLGVRLFATIFALGLRGLGRHTKVSGSLIVATISGGAVLPPMTGAVATHLQKKKSNKPFHTVMLIPMAGLICAWIYPIYANLFNKATMDSHRKTEVGILAAPSTKEIMLIDRNVANKDGGRVTNVEHV
jgi:fucose permease